MIGSWIDLEGPPVDASLAKAWWCDVGYFLAHTATGDYPECGCPQLIGHNDPDFLAKRDAWVRSARGEGT